MIFVDEALRGRGIGTALTEAVVDELDAAGCVVARPDRLAARPARSTSGSVPRRDRLPDRRGGRRRTTLATPRGPRRGRRTPAGPTAWPTSDDLPAILALDARRTGEDRRPHPAAGAEPRTAIVALDPEAASSASSSRSPWGTHPTVAPELADGVRLLEDRAAGRPAGVEARTALPEANRAGSTLETSAGRTGSSGWSEAPDPLAATRRPQLAIVAADRPPRMIRRRSARRPT